MDHEELVGRIDGLPSLKWGGEAWRHVSMGRPGLSGEGARVVGGRWNPAASFAVLYLGLSLEVVIAEFHRLATRQRLAPDHFLPRALYRYDIKLHDVLDLREAAVREKLALSDADLRAAHPKASQAVGEAAFACGREAILAPSATGAGQILALYLERLSPDSTIREDQVEVWEEIPPEP